MKLRLPLVDHIEMLESLLAHSDSKWDAATEQGAVRAGDEVYG